jgi:hypothetical protein
VGTSAVRKILIKYTRGGTQLLSATRQLATIPYLKVQLAFGE